MTDPKPFNAYTLRRLLLSKQLYIHGLDHSNNGGALNKMIAVHNFHNAIEITLRAISFHYIRSNADNIGFKDLLTEIVKHFKTFDDRSMRLPYSGQLNQLNTIRNIAQHDAVEPPDSTMEEWRVFTRLFLEKSFKAYFELEFDNVSAIDMIEDEDLKEILKLSELSIKENNFKKSLSFSHIAFLWAIDNISSLIPRGRERALNGFYMSSYLQGVKEKDCERSIKRVTDEIAEKIDEIEHFIILLSTGINLIDYEQFQSSRSFSIQFTPAGELISYNLKHEELSQKTTQWSHRFVVDTIVHWQVLGLNPNVPEMLRTAAQKLINPDNS